MPSLHSQLLMQALADERLRRVESTVVAIAEGHRGRSDIVAQRRSGPGEPLPFMRPDVTELPHRCEAVTPDTFIDDLCATATFPPAPRDASRA